ncbi:hypothetical protein BurJ1DRAFT_3394 [Burkholderiales bacterium JOSHI_001]|nr:hypothetical protein BurJ1DRAFT_3394 [Burkholderiales bacterium JOSHI_001]
MHATRSAEKHPHAATARKKPAVTAKTAAAPKAKPVPPAAAPAPAPAIDKKPAVAASPVSKATKAVKPPKATKPPKPVKLPKAGSALVRDSFTMPEDDFKRIATLKARALKAQRPAKKSELLRAGLHVLEGLTAAALVQVLNRLVTLKPGRPKKHH